jgi:hypothetical protein
MPLAFATLGFVISGGPRMFRPHHRALAEYDGRYKADQQLPCGLVG